MLIKLKVHPDSKRDDLVKKSPDAYEAWVKAPASGGRANAACLALLGRALGVAPGRLRIVKGSRSPSKIVEVP